MIKIEQENEIVLHPFSEEDTKRLCEILTNDIIKKTYMIPDFDKEEDLLKLVHKIFSNSLSKQHYEKGIYVHQELIGFINDVEINQKKIEIGYVIYPPFFNHGYATQAVKKAIQELFQLGFDEVIAEAFSQNLASQRVMQKCGMIKQNKQSELTYHGKIEQIVSYSIRKE